MKRDSKTIDESDARRDKRAPSKPSGHSRPHPPPSHWSIDALLALDARGREFREMIDRRT
jgi:hypothetical protein